MIDYQAIADEIRAHSDAILREGNAHPTCNPGLSDRAYSMIQSACEAIGGNASTAFAGVGGYLPDALSEAIEAAESFK